MSAILIVKRSVLAIVLVSTAMPSKGVALAQPTSAAAQQPDAARVKSAEIHFSRGVELFNEGNASAAMVEFRRAYELAPRFQILYNMGQVAYELNDYATAVALFEQYLASAGTNIAEDRRKSVTEEIARLKVRVGQVRVVVDLPHVNVAVDDIPVGRTPLAPIVVNIGRRRITISTAEGGSSTRIVEVPSGETVVAKFVLRNATRARPVVPLRATLPPPQGTSTGAAIAWVATGGLAAGAAVFGTLALQESRELNNLRETYPIDSPDRLKDKRDSVARRAFIADGLMASAVLVGGLALLLSLSSSSPSQSAAGPKTHASTSLVPSIGLGGLSLQGTF